MAHDQQRPDLDAPSPELAALNAVVTALKSLRDDARQRVINAALMLLGGAPMSAATTQQQFEHIAADGSASHAGGIPTDRLSERLPITDIRTLKEEKKPSNAVEMATLVAYYLTEIAPPNERKDTIESEDIKKYFRLAQFRLPANPPHQTLKYAKYAGYLDAVDRGSYKLNPVGYNLIVHGLPSEENNAPSKRRRKTNNEPAKKQATKKQPQKKTNKR